MWLQAERDEKKWVDMEKQAVLAAQAAALRTRMTESHLAKFRSEYKNRCGAQLAVGYLPCVSCMLKIALYALRSAWIRQHQYDDRSTATCTTCSAL